MYTIYRNCTDLDRFLGTVVRRRYLKGECTAFGNLVASGIRCIRNLFALSGLSIFLSSWILEHMPSVSRKPTVTLLREELVLLSERERKHASLTLGGQAFCSGSHAEELPIIAVLAYLRGE
jgi:hypothetical protein